jgi:2-amino-4-hydroxy-6-hydroxymethyldihydropteridine diphosphokinase
VRNITYLSLGSNLGDRAGNLRAAIEKLSGFGEVVAVSSFYETEPVELTNQPWFVNCAVALETEQVPEAFLGELLALEQSMGRRRTQKKGPRTIDIDMLLFGDAIIETAGLSIPHPAMHQRRFVLVPMAEIAPEQRHPILKRSMRELLDALPPGAPVRQILSSEG